MLMTIMCVWFDRDSIAAQLQLALAKADSEQLARQIAEEQLSDVEKEKTMLELEIKELMSRFKNDISKKESMISIVSTLWDLTGCTAHLVHRQPGVLGGWCNQALGAD